MKRSPKSFTNSRPASLETDKSTAPAVDIAGDTHTICWLPKQFKAHQRQTIPRLVSDVMYRRMRRLRTDLRGGRDKGSDGEDTAARRGTSEAAHGRASDKPAAADRHRRPAGRRAARRKKRRQDETACTDSQ